MFRRLRAVFQRHTLDREMRAEMTIAALATWIPARRAATINPVTALRAE